MNQTTSQVTCLITGASSGIGRAIALRLVQRGERIICTARDLDRLRATFAQHADSAYCVALDVTDGRAVAGFLDDLPDLWRHVDVVIANAGSDIGGRREFLAGDADEWATTIDTNVNGVMRVCHAVLPGMVERGRGHVVTLGSTAGLKTYVGGVAYAASKFAVRAFTDALRLEFKHSPIRITEILPGTARTGFAEARHRGDSARADAFYDGLPDAMTAEDVASAVMFALDQPPGVNIAQILLTPTLDK